jgi:hypothetical protein
MPSWGSAVPEDANLGLGGLRNAELCSGL